MDAFRKATQKIDKLGYGSKLGKKRRDICNRISRRKLKDEIIKGNF